MSGHELLRAILNDPQFAWLRPVSELIVRIDETLENDLAGEVGTPGDVSAIIIQARTLVYRTRQAIATLSGITRHSRSIPTRYSHTAA